MPKILQNYYEECKSSHEMRILEEEKFMPISTTTTTEKPRAPLILSQNKATIQRLDSKPQLDFPDFLTER